MLMVHSKLLTLMPIYYYKKYAFTSSLRKIKLPLALDKEFETFTFKPKARIRTDDGVVEELRIVMCTEGYVEQHDERGTWLVVLFAVNHRFDYVDFSKCSLELS
eukprot:Lankesteria_metandrocarpae@DN2094_c0_g1_i2.p1